MIENENHSLRDRVGDLEKKVHEQNDEIMCLRSTLADVLRRLTTVEASNKCKYKCWGEGWGVREGKGGVPVIPSSQDRQDL